MEEKTVPQHFLKRIFTFFTTGKYPFSSKKCVQTEKVRGNRCFGYRVNIFLSDLMSTLLKLKILHIYAVELKKQ